MNRSLWHQKKERSIERSFFVETGFIKPPSYDCVMTGLTFGKAKPAWLYSHSADQFS